MRLQQHLICQLLTADRWRLAADYILQTYTTLWRANIDDKPDERDSKGDNN